MMGGFRRARLRGSDELFRPTNDDATPTEQNLDLPVDEIAMAATVTKPSPLDDGGSAVPNAPGHDSRSLRLSSEEITIIAEALQHLKFPHKAPARPSVDEFERLEALRQRLLESL